MLPLVIQIERTDEHVADTCAFAKSPVRVGRNPLSDLQLDESFVSQWHGVIRFDEERTTYLDLGATNPTLVDGQPVNRNMEIEVSESTDIRIGSLRLHLLRVAAPAELFGARRKSSFVRAGVPALNAGAATIHLDALANVVPRLSAQLSAAAVSRKPIAVAPVASPPSQPAVPAAPTPGRVQPSARSEPAPADLDGAYSDYQASRVRLLSRVRARLEAQPANARAATLERIMHDYPELAHEPELRELIGKLGIESWRTGVPDVSDWLRRLTSGLYPPAGLTPNAALALERIGELLEVWSTAFVELRSAHEQFCDEMALERPGEESLLDTTNNPRAVLAYLLNPDTGQSSKVTDLARAMADYAVHQVALVSAVVEGAREVLQGLSPAALTGRSERPGASFFGKLLGQDQRALWARYVAAFDETLDEDRFTRKLFGRGFARKYYAITGGRRSIASPPGGASASGS